MAMQKGEPHCHTFPPRHPVDATHDRFGCPLDGPPSPSANRRTLGADRVLRRSGGARSMRCTSDLGELTMPARKGLARARGLLCVLFGLALVSGASFSSSVRAEDMPDDQLVRCNSIVSFDKRLLMEQWAMPGQCSRPTWTRVTDQFLDGELVAHARKCFRADHQAPKRNR